MTPSLFTVRTTQTMEYVNARSIWTESERFHDSPHCASMFKDVMLALLARVLNELRKRSLGGSFP
jgi:hypothetical protein